MPSALNVDLADLFHGTIFPCHKLCKFHVWISLVYVLDSKILNGQKLPGWKPKSTCGVFLGYSPTNSSDVPLVLNLATGHIPPQYHVVFDDAFSTVQSISDD